METADFTYMKFPVYYTGWYIETYFSEDLPLDATLCIHISTFYILNIIFKQLLYPKTYRNSNY